MGKFSTKPIAVLSAVLIGGGIFLAATGLFADPDNASAINSELFGNSGSTTTTPTTTDTSSSSSSTTTLNTTTTTEEDTITNPDTADEDWVMIVIMLGVAGLAFSLRQYFARR